MNQSRSCMFCFAERSGSIQRSAEHFLSRPAAQAFGIDREAGEVYRFGGNDTAPRVVRLNGLKRRCVCRDCNSGWMNRLEHRMPEVAHWFTAGNTELTEDLNLALRKWALARHLLLTEIDGNAAEFGDTDNLEEDYVIPLSSLARAVFEDNAQAILEVPIAIGRSSEGLEFAWAFGHPTVRPTDRPQLGRFAATSVLTLGELQLWIVTPIIFDYEIYAPAGLSLVRSGLKSSDLTARSGIPRSDELTVAFLDVDETGKMLDDMTQLSEADLLAMARPSPPAPS